MHRDPRLCLLARVIVRVDAVRCGDALGGSGELPTRVSAGGDLVIGSGVALEGGVMGSGPAGPSRRR